MWPDRDKLALGWASSFEEYGVPKGVGGGSLYCVRTPQHHPQLFRELAVHLSKRKGVQERGK